ncbi:MAG: chromate efflux transporter [Erysipelotrichaceae bacterium]|nr:chromate efflux transporter [Erysipelotrichaceae bacterium]
MNQKPTTLSFLKDVLICSLGAFGGPEAHYGVFTQQMVLKKHYLSEEELLELIALTQVLPGPSSTQTIIAIGHKVGGPWLGFLTLLVWALPIVSFMTLLSFMFEVLDNNNISTEIVRYVGAMAVGFILIAAIKISKKVIKDKFTIGLLLLSAITTYFIRQAWIYPVLLFIGGSLSILTHHRKVIWNKITLIPPWVYLWLFLFFAVGNLIGATLFPHPLIILFEKFYRYGYLVIGGGQVVIPLMYSELVEIFQYMSSQEFLVGYGFVQGMPGPMFSFTAFVGGLALRDQGTFIQTLGGFISALGIFLPGTLLIYFIYPIWEQVKKIDAIQVSLKGILAIAGGFIVIAAVILLQRINLDLINVFVLVLTSILLWTNKVPAPLIVFSVLLLGILG